MVTLLTYDCILSANTDIIGGRHSVVAIVAVYPLVALTRGGGTGRETKDNKLDCMKECNVVNMHQIDNLVLLKDVPPLDFV